MVRTLIRLAAVAVLMLLVVSGRRSERSAAQAPQGGVTATDRCTHHRRHRPRCQSSRARS